MTLDPQVPEFPSKSLAEFSKAEVLTWKKPRGFRDWIYSSIFNPKMPQVSTLSYLLFHRDRRHLMGISLPTKSMNLFAPIHSSSNSFPIPFPTGFHSWFSCILPLKSYFTNTDQIMSFLKLMYYFALLLGWRLKCLMQTTVLYKRWPLASLTLFDWQQHSPSSQSSLSGLPWFPQVCHVLAWIFPLEHILCFP